MDRSARLMLLVVMVALGVGLQVGVPEAAQLEVAESLICQKVAERDCVDPALSFPSQVGTLYCWSRVVGAVDPQEVTHVWYFGEKERARVTLPVRSVAWRTYTSKRIQPHETGTWRVDILGPGGQVLKTISFEVTP